MQRLLSSGHWYVLTAFWTVDQEFDSDANSYAAALSWAVSQAITGRTRYIVGYADDDGSFVPYIVVSHPDTLNAS